MSDLQWKRPPSRGQYDWDDIAEQLKANPGKWALVAPSYSSNKVTGATSRGLTVRTQRLGTSPARYDVYARYEAP
jgi:hypothetical protein